MKKILSLILLLAKAATAFSQQPIVVSAGGGVNAVKGNSYLGNGYTLHANVFIPFLNKSNHWFTPGILAGGNYITAKDLAPGTDAYKLYNGNLNISNTQHGRTPGSGFTGQLGLQANLSFGPIVLSPSISGGYFSFSQNGSAQTTTIIGNNGTQQTVTLYDRQKVKTTGLVTIPQLKLSLPLVKTFSIYASAGLNIGPKMDIAQRRLEPAGGFNDNNTYEPSQLTAGNMIAQPAIVNYRSLMLSAGVSWRLGGKNKRSATADTARNPLYDNGGHSVQNPMYGRAMPGSPIGGIVVKGGKNPGGNMMVVTSNNNGTFELNDLDAGLYRFTLEIPDQSAKKDTRTYTGGRKNEAQARPGNPIGGVIVKGGKNPGGDMSNLTVQEDGSIEFEVLETGNYQFRIQTSESGSGKVKENRRSGLKDVVKTQV